MKKVLSIVLILALCILLGACGKGEEALKVLPSATQNNAAQKALPESDETPSATAAEVSRSVQPKTPPPGETGPLNFAHAPEVYAAPDAFAGKKYESLYKIISPKQQYDGKQVYYAAGYIKGSGIKTYTVLDFQYEKVPDFAVDDIVYARGVIEGTGSLMNEAGNKMDMLWLKVTDMETNAAKEKIAPKSKKYNFAGGQFTAKSGPLTIEVAALDFSADSLLLTTKTADSSVKANTTYFFDIVLHQEGIFAWYNNCNFWIAPNSAAGFDSIPLSMLDSAKDITAEFVAYSEDGKLLYEPLSVKIRLAQ